MTITFVLLIIFIFMQLTFAIGIVTLFKITDGILNRVEHLERRFNNENRRNQKKEETDEENQ